MRRQHHFGASAIMQMAQMVAEIMLAGIDGHRVDRNGASMQSPALYICTREEKREMHQKFKYLTIRLLVI